MSALPITLVIPFYNEALALPSFLSQMEEQFLKLEEVLFVDSGSNDGGAELINNFRNSHKSKLNIKVLKVDSKDKNGKEKIALPGESRNIGIKEAGTPWIAFLDLGIAVDANWLTTMWQLVQKRPESGALGKCLFYGRDSFTKALCALTNGVGQAGTTLPGALINRKVFSEIGFFPEYLRSAEDLVWREKFTESYGELTPEKAVISYSTYPENIIQVLKKWFTYSKNTVWAGVSLKQ
ncbi:MAG: glycosyltransferase family 2 protein, partial [Halobacteriovoraceae bacterium]|nr:glycosyltransferase family 2 protein [Halobacteriovoraceae bacterium]